jgi:hypothetical protein
MGGTGAGYGYGYGYGRARLADDVTDKMGALTSHYEVRQTNPDK